MKKGRHRRFEEARALKRFNEELVEACAECGAKPGSDHASWCLAMEDEEPVDDGEEAVDEGQEEEHDGPRAGWRATAGGDRSAPTTYS